MDLVLMLLLAIAYITVLMLSTEPQPHRPHTTAKEAFMDNLLENYVHGKRYSDDYANLYCAMEVYIALCNYEKGIIPKQAYLLDYVVRATGKTPVDIQYERILTTMKYRKVKIHDMGTFYTKGTVQVENGIVQKVEQHPQHKQLQVNSKLSHRLFPWNRNKNKEA